MKELDGRKIDHKTRETIRIRAVKRILAGESPEVIAKVLGYNRSCVYDWLKKYEQGGFEALKTRKISGRPPKLTEAQKKQVFDIVTSKNPLQLKFPFALLTCAMVRELVQDKFGVTLSEVSVGRLLRNLGLTPQRPLHRAWQQDPQRVDKWFTEDYPAIQKEAKRLGHHLFWRRGGHPLRLPQRNHVAVKGQTPVVRTSGSRHSLNMISAISAKGTMRFMTVKGRLTTNRFIEFLERLIKNQAQPIFLVVDGHPVHRAARVRQFVNSTGGRLKLFYLPFYSPELNSDEQVWNQLKNHSIGKMVIQNLDDLKQKVQSKLRSIQRSPVLIKSFFRHPECCYTIA